MATVTNQPVLLHFYHGTDIASAQDIMNHGLDAGRAAALNVGGEFWATTDPVVADTFAQVNPAGGPPARLAFDLPVVLVQTLLGASVPLLFLHPGNGFEFLPGAFPRVNHYMGNVVVV